MANQGRCSGISLVFVDDIFNLSHVWPCFGLRASAPGFSLGGRGGSAV